MPLTCMILEGTVGDVQQFEFMEKDRLLPQMREGYDGLMALVNSLDESQLTGPIVYGELTGKDVLAHIAAWANMAAGWIEGSLRGEKPVRFAPGYELVPGETDYDPVINALNQHIYEQHKDLSLDQVRDQLARADSRLRTVTERLSDDDLNDPTRFEWRRGGPVWPTIAANSYWHYAEHAQGLSEMFGTGAAKG
jgi:hypothetical protein